MLLFAKLTNSSESQSQKVDENFMMLLELHAKLVNLLSLGRSSGSADILLYSRNNYFRLGQLRIAYGN
jgi:hypothetical protein